MTSVPVYRYRDFDDARRALWTRSDAPDLAERIRRLWSFAARLRPRRMSRGVKKFRDMTEANRDRASRAAERRDST